MFRNGIFILLLFAGLTAHSRNLIDLIKQADTASTVTTFHRLAEEIEQEASSDSGNWLVYYWSSFNYTAAAYLSPREKKDELLDKAQLLLEKAIKLSPAEAENFLLQSWIYSTRVTVAPASRAKQYGDIANETREKAYNLDPANPRYYFLKGTSFYFVPPAMGGGKTKAKPFFEEALEKFKDYQSKGELYPCWGFKQTTELLENCN